MSDTASTPARQVLTPSALNRLARELIEDVLPMVWIEGEISNLARPASGHMYFSLKDAHAQVRCAMFRPRVSRLRERPADGAHVLLRARVSLYEARGEFQLIVEEMEAAGEGALRREFERLKAALQAEGLFDSERKRPLPRFPRRIGVITSPTGAAIRDVLSVLGRRFALAEIELLPVPVQGREAPPAIVSMLNKAAASGRYDVLLLTRGGGSLEDLWAFNDEAVARAVHASAVPVVCAVGHEVDFSIAEFAADLRAATPSAAAELLVPDAVALRQRLAGQRRQLQALLQRRLQAWSQKLDHQLARLQTQRPQARLRQGRERLVHVEQRLHRSLTAGTRRLRVRVDHNHARLLARHPEALLEAARSALQIAYHQLAQGMRRDLKRREAIAASARRTLHAISPLATLERGFAIVLDENGRLLRSAASVTPDDMLAVRLVDGTLDVRVTGKR